MLVFFDLDRTLLSTNSAVGWIRQEYREGRMGTGMLLRAGWWLAQYHLRGTGMEEAISDAAMTLKGLPEEDLVQRTEAYWERECLAAVRPDAYRVLEEHRAAGDTLVIITGSSIYLATAAARALGIPHVLANRFEVEAGIFSGEVIRPLSYGQGKVDLAEAFSQEHAGGVPLLEARFYTDSYSDLPLLLAVGEPIVVHPDPRLLREAQRRGWELQDWGEV